MQRVCQAVTYDHGSSRLASPRAPCYVWEWFGYESSYETGQGMGIGRANIQVMEISLAVSRESMPTADDEQKLVSLRCPAFVRESALRPGLLMTLRFRGVATRR
jgi:hypothetical protein